jgi:hypothetical protein
MTKQFQLCEWGHGRLGKLHRCPKITSGSLDTPDYPTCPRKCFLVVIRPWRVIMWPTDYHDITARNIIPDCRILWVFSERKLFPVYGTAWRTAHLTVSRARFQLSDVQVLWSWHHLLRIWGLFSAISPIVDVGFVKLTSGSFCVNRVFKMNIQFCCPVSCVPVFCDFWKTVLLNVRRSLSANVKFRPSFLFAD